MEGVFLIHAKEDHYFLTHLDEVVINAKTGTPFPVKTIRSVFKKVKTYTDDSASLFINYLHKVMKWHQYLELQHPHTTIRENELQISLSLSSMPDETFRQTDWRNPALLKYTEQNGQWCKPKFQLKIKNTGPRKLWLSLLYFDSLYGIDNILIPKQEVNPGEEVSASYVSDGTTKFDIPVQVEEGYLNQDITTIQEYLKLIVATEEFYTDNFTQKGIPLGSNIQDRYRGLAIHSIKKSDWKTVEIPLEIYRPIESKGRHCL